MNSLNKADRRTFLRSGALGAGALWVGSLQELSARRAHGEYSRGRSKKKGGGGPDAYGPPSPKPDETTGLNLLQLPEGFRYWSYSWTGDVMSDGVICPSLHDGMAVVDEWSGKDDDDDDDDSRHRSSRLVLVRNHEAANGNPYLDRPAITYANDGAGGTTNLLFDAKAGKWLEAWSSLAGTVRNCAGAVTPWGTWISQEETVVAGHGWSFEVGATKDCSTGGATPLHDMGRFSHEASMVDPKTGYVYETEDSGDCGFYRFVPYSRGNLAQGGKLYMMSVKDQPNADLGGDIPIGTTWDVRWVRIDDPAATSTSCYGQGSAKGGARFRRLEGAWWGDGVGYFVSTDGGSVREGQLFEYDPRDETLKLVYDSPVANELDNPDNIVVTPRGGILFCEDAAGGSNVAAERLVGLTADGEAFTFAINNVNLSAPRNSRVPAGNYTGSEWAGACYSPDGRWLFVNIQTPGVTFAITGPWGHGPL
jgi:secreted PhoX family phosphatase